MEDNYLKKELYELIKSDESIFYFIQESSMDGLWYWDLENPENEWMNPKFWTVLGYNPEEMPHKASSWQSIINQDDLNAAIERVSKHLENPGYPYDQIVRYTHKNGSSVWIRCRGMAIRDKNGKPVRMLGAHHDISELKSLEEDLIFSNEKAEENNSNIKAILEGTKDSIWSFDRNYNIIYINNIFQNEFESSFGIRLEKDSNLVMALPEYLRPFWEPRYRRVLSGEQFSIVDEVDTAIGRLYIQVTFNPIIKNGVVTGGSCFGSNITERKKAEEAKLLREERLQKQNNALIALMSKGSVFQPNLQQAISEITETFSKLVETERVSVWLYNDDFSEIKCTNLFDGITQQHINTRQILRCADFPTYFDCQKRGEVIDAVDVFTDPRTLELPAAYYKEHNIRSMLDTPVWFHDRLGGVLCFEHTGEKREWTSEDVRLATSMAALLSLCFQNEERRQAEESLKKSETEYRNLFDNANDAILILDPQTEIILDANNKSCEIYGFLKDEFIGMSLKSLSIDVQAGNEKIEHTLKNGHFNNFETQQINKKGEVIHFLVNASVIDYRGSKAILSINRNITERKQAEAELRQIQKNLAEKEAQYRLIAENSTDLIYVFCLLPQPHYKYISPSCLQLTGYEPELGYSDPFTYHKFINTPSGVERFTQFLLNPEQPPRIEEEWKRKDGSYIWVEQVVVRNFDENGNLISFQSTVRDITERKHAEALFQDIIDKNPMSIQILDLEGFTIKTNYAHTKLFGVKPPPNYSMFKDAQLLRLGFEEIFQRIKDGEIVYFPDTYYNVHNIDPNYPDTPVWIKAVGFPLYDKNRNPEYFVLMHEDITERKRAEQELIASKEKAERQEIELIKVQAITHVGSWYLNLETNEVFWTEELYKMYGFDPSLPPPPYTEHQKLFTNESWDILSKSLARTSETGIPYELELKTIRKDKTNGWMWVRGDAIFDNNNKIIGLWGAAQDITERKKIEEELLAAKEKAEESDRLKSAFLANMSHEIRTPMNGILGFANLLKQPNVDGNEKLEYVEIIEKSGQRMLNIINDIIDISKIEAGLIELKLTESNINEQFEFIYTFFKAEADEKGLKLTVKNPSFTDKLYLNTDREKLYAVLTNLVKNAIKYTEKGEIELGFVPKGNFIEFYVKDTGIGIPNDRKHAIFERFIQADIEDMMARQGAGLGLAISKAYIEMMGGTIWVESEVGKGSVFIFNLPFDSKIENKPKIQSSQQVDDSVEITSTINILIAEDDIISEKLLEYELKSYIKKLYKTRSGLEAVEIMRNNPNIQLILMDIRMPQMNGYEATRQIRQFNKNVIIIAQTAYGLTGDREKAIEAGCNDYIAKPIQKEELLKKIEKYIIGVDRK